MRVADGIEVLDLSTQAMGWQDSIHPTLIWDDEATVLVDAGFPGQLAQLREAIERAGARFERLDHVILTHHDLDHIGGLPEVLNERPAGIQVMAAEAEAPYVQGEKRPVKFRDPAAIDRAVASLPAAMPEEQRVMLRAVLEHYPRARVDRVLRDGEKLPFGGGLTVIATPGHTPGHITLYHRASMTLVAGDALQAAAGELVGPWPGLTLDVAKALQSLRRFAGYEIRNVICYHGGLWSGDANRRIAEIAQGRGHAG